MLLVVCCFVDGHSACSNYLSLHLFFFFFERLFPSSAPGPWEYVSNKKKKLFQTKKQFSCWYIYVYHVVVLGFLLFYVCLPLTGKKKRKKRNNFLEDRSIFTGFLASLLITRFPESKISLGFCHVVTVCYWFSCFISFHWFVCCSHSISCFWRASLTLWFALA